jgi:hypothetical protein
MDTRSYVMRGSNPTGPMILESDYNRARAEGKTWGDMVENLPKTVGWVEEVD